MVPRTHLPAHFTAAFLILAAFGCGGPTPARQTGPTESPGQPAPTAANTQTTNVEPQPGDWLVENLGAEPALLNPILDLVDAGGRYICSRIFDTLIDLDNETLEFIPNIAEKWEISDDHLVYTFYLRKDAVYSDGVPVTAHDVKFTYDLIKNPAVDAAAARSYFVDVQSAELVDDYTIRFTCVKPYFRHILTLGALEPIPRHVYGQGDFNRHPNNRHPIGSGPYKFEKWETGQQISLVRNERYWGPKPMLDRHVLKIITDDNASFQVLERHEIDIMQMQPEMWKRRASTPQFEREFAKLTPQSPIPGYLSRFGYIGWNMRKPQFEDKRVRRALTMLLDRQTILDRIYMGLGTLISGDCFPGEPEYNPNVKPLPFAPQEAVKLLEQAGWIDADRDGVREKNGVPFTFELSYAADIPEYDRMATVYQEELTRAGIKMSPRPLEWAVFQERVQKRTFDACMLAWLTTPLYDPYQLWHSSQAEEGSNYPGFKNAEADAIMENARVEFDRAKRVEMYHRFHEILDEEQPYTFLFSRNGLIALDKRFQNVQVYPLGLDPLEWWVPAELRRYK
ncbi:MAG: hypothetical protein AMXMBFR4_00090 [Candidatus Hydrogenedentota bacterium]